MAAPDQFVATCPDCAGALCEGQCRTCQGTGYVTESAAELECIWLRSEIRAVLKRWRFNADVISTRSGGRSRKEIIAQICAEIESVLEGGR